MLKILSSPNPILFKKTQMIKKIDSGTVKLASEMIETCRKVNGIGLAAPQIGHSIRLCIINLEEFGVPPMVLVNPEIKKKSWKKIEMEEGCLSVPDIFGMVKRPERIKVRALNLEGKPMEFSAEGLLARVVQHEVDHLDGILFTSKTNKYTTHPRAKKM
jgi:peptide deformylase